MFNHLNLLLKALMNPILFGVRFLRMFNFIFYASAPKVPEALCFRVVRPSGFPSGSPSGFFRLRDNSSIT